MMRAFLVLSIGFLLRANAFGQTVYNLPPTSFHEKATIGLKSFKILEVEQLTIAGDSVKYRLGRTSESLHFNDINYINVRERGKAKEGALIGGASMLLLSLLAVLEVQSDPDYNLKDNAGGLVCAYTLGGAGLGALIGGSISRKKTYYIHIPSR